MKRRVLVADDESDMVELLAFVCNNEGWEVVKAYDGEAAIQAALTHEPDLILLDLVMPKLDGIAVCEFLRRHHTTAHIPILMLTGCHSNEAHTLGTGLGASEYITKPFSPRQVAQRARQLIAETTPVLPPELRVNRLVMDVGLEMVHLNGSLITLSHGEFRALAIATETLLRKAGSGQVPLESNEKEAARKQTKGAPASPTDKSVT
ncbi:MAG: response regulator transcription factor [Verrucomicrobiota bacterium]